MVDEEVQHALPEVLVLQYLAKPRADHRTGQRLATAQATYLCPAHGGGGRLVVRCLGEQVGHGLREAERQTGGADVLSKPEMLVPAVLREEFARR